MKRPEQALHISAVAFLRRALPEPIIVFHPANGGRRSKAEAALFKAMGVLPGVPDLVLIMPNAQAAFIEFKAGAGVMSDAQIDFKQCVTACGCAYAVVRSMEQLEELIEGWLAAYGLEPRARIARRTAA